MYFHDIKKDSGFQEDTRGSYVVKIRLKRLGAKKTPYYRIVVTDSRNRRDGCPIEELGDYNPRSKELKLNLEAVKQWMNNGAQVSETVASLIRKAEAAVVAS
jgi:small subunit ribosomal protein S16